MVRPFGALSVRFGEWAMATKSSKSQKAVISFVFIFPRVTIQELGVQCTAHELLVSLFLDGQCNAPV